MERYESQRQNLYFSPVLFSQRCVGRWQQVCCYCCLNRRGESTLQHEVEMRIILKIDSIPSSLAWHLMLVNNLTYLAARKGEKLEGQKNNIIFDIPCSTAKAKSFKNWRYAREQMLQGAKGAQTDILDGHAHADRRTAYGQSLASCLKYILFFHIYIIYQDKI